MKRRGSRQTSARPVGRRHKARLRAERRLAIAAFEQWQRARPASIRSGADS